jgi:hypothetical protein
MNTTQKALAKEVTQTMKLMKEAFELLDNIKLKKSFGKIGLKVEQKNFRPSFLIISIKKKHLFSTKTTPTKYFTKEKT